MIAALAVVAVAVLLAVDHRYRIIARLDQRWRR